MALSSVAETHCHCPEMFKWVFAARKRLKLLEIRACCENDYLRGEAFLSQISSRFCALKLDAIVICLRSP